MIQIGLEGDRLLAMQRGDISLSVFSPIITPVVKKAGMRILLDLEELKVPYLLTGHGTTRELLGKESAGGRLSLCERRYWRSNESKTTGHLPKKCSPSTSAPRIKKQ